MKIGEMKQLRANEDLYHKLVAKVAKGNGNVSTVQQQMEMGMFLLYNSKWKWECSHCTTANGNGNVPTVKQQMEMRKFSNGNVPTV